MNQKVKDLDPDKLLISVVVPLYNVEKYMKKCIDSILEQTFKQIEIILVNDGSPDNSGEIAEEYKILFENVKVIHKENGGLSSARNAGMEIAKGDYILFVDSDDWIEPNLLEETYNEIVETNSEICVFNVRRIYENTLESFIQGKTSTSIIKLKEYGVANYIRNFLLNPEAHRYSAWNRLYQLNFLKKNELKFEPNKEIHSEDMLFNLQSCSLASKICYVEQPLYNHLLRDGTISSSKKPKITIKLMTLVDRFIENSIKTNQYDNIKSVIPDLTQYLFFMAVGSEVKINKLNLVELKKEIKLCYNFVFFQKAMEKMSKRSLNKRNITSFFLGYKKHFLSSTMIYLGLNFSYIKGKSK